MIYYSTKNDQSGIVLVISLLVLLLLTIIGVSAMQTNLLEEKMAGNSRDQNIAFQAAESALLEAEKFILDNLTNNTIYTGSNGLLDIGDLEPTDFFDLSWASNNSQEASNPNSLIELASNPRFIIKKVSQIVSGTETKTYFKITARAVGRNAGTQIILQEHFVHKKQLN